MPLYRRKSTVIHAEQFRGGREAGRDWYLPKGVFVSYNGLEGTKYYVETIHAQRVYLADGDWVLPEPDGRHYYPCQPAVFASTYELVRQSNFLVRCLEGVSLCCKHIFCPPSYLPPPSASAAPAASAAPTAFATEWQSPPPPSPSPPS